MQGDDSVGENRDVLVLLAVPLEIFLVFRRFGTAGVRGFAAGRSGVLGAMPHNEECVPRRHAQVGASLGRDRRNDLPQAVRNVVASDPAGAVVGFFEYAVAPDVFRQRPGVIDVLEPLADGVVAEPLADRLRSVPTVDELRASRPQLFSREHHQISCEGGAVQALGLKPDDCIAGGHDELAGSSNVAAERVEVGTVKKARDAGAQVSSESLVLPRRLEIDRGGFDRLGGTEWATEAPAPAAGGLREQDVAAQVARTPRPRRHGEGGALAAAGPARASTRPRRTR